MCVFSPSPPPPVPCRFIPGPNGALPPQLRVPVSSPHQPFLLPLKRLKLLHPRLLTGLPETTERISTQIKRALLVWCQGFETRLILFDQWAPMLVTLLHHAAAPSFRPFLSLYVSLNWSPTEKTKKGLFGVVKALFDRHQEPEDSVWRTEATEKEFFGIRMGFADPKWWSCRWNGLHKHFQCRVPLTCPDGSRTLWRVFKVPRSLSFSLYEGHFYLRPTLCSM